MLPCRSGSSLLRASAGGPPRKHCCCLPQPWGSRGAAQPQVPAAPPVQLLPPQPPPAVAQAAAEPELLAPPPPPPMAPRPQPPSLFDIMKFNGPAPELINGRLAMIGVLAAAKEELQGGGTALQQAQTAPPWLWAALLLWVYASLVPISKGARHEAFGIFSPRAEITNGRAAMLGFAILAALEYKAGVPFF